MSLDAESGQYIINLITTWGLRVIGALAILIIGWAVAKWAERMTRGALSRSSRVDSTLTGFVSSLAKYLVLVFTIIAVLNQFGVQTASLIAVVGAAGLAIGLAMQGTLSNIAAGVMLLIFRPFRVGDYVEVSGQSGTVDTINLFVTELCTPDNKQIIVPNSNIWGQAVVNYSYHPRRRLDLEIGISYESDIDEATRAIQEILDADERALKEPEPLIAVGNLGASSVDLTVRVWVKAEDYWGLKFDLTKRLKQTFDERGIGIPYPQMDLHLRKQD
ncbi:MAG TPA: mechanosensitive ion channel domain-containing protein [Arenicellales bacterium]|nr:mechanosensitive ion channel domain-containing protein [Arenicellales bacterium]